MFNPLNRITMLLAIGAINCTTLNDEGVGSPAPTSEQIRAAQTLDQSIRQLENQEALSIFAQSRAFRELRDTEAYKLIESSDGGNFVSWGQYVSERTSKSPPTVSQNITVVTTFDRFPDEELAKAGREKLYVASIMIGAGNVFATVEAALAAAQSKTRVELLAMRNSGGTVKPNTVFLAPIRVTLGQQERWSAGYEKFNAIYTEVHGAEGSNMQVTDFYNDVVSGLPMDFLRTAAQGEGGAGPEMEGGFTPKDVPIEEIVHYVAMKLMDGGRDPMEVIEGLEISIQGLKDRHAIEEADRKEREKAEAKDVRMAEKAQGKWAARLTKLRQHQSIDFADGSKVSVADTNISADGQINGVWLKGIHDGSENTFAEDSTLYPIERIVAFGIVGINPAPKVEKVKAAAIPGTKAASNKKAAPKNAASKIDSATPAGGMSKAQSAGKSKKAKSQAEQEGLVGPA